MLNESLKGIIGVVDHKVLLSKLYYDKKLSKKEKLHIFQNNYQTVKIAIDYNSKI